MTRWTNFSTGSCRGPQSRPTMNNKRIPTTREEKIQFLKDLAAGKISAKDIIPTTRLCLFEKTPGKYESLVFLANGGYVPSLRNIKAADVGRFAKKMRQIV